MENSLVLLAAAHADEDGAAADRVAQVVVDGPLVAALAEVGFWPTFAVDLDVEPVVAQNTMAELQRAWVDGVPGAELIDMDTIRTVPMPLPAEGARDPALTWRELAHAWRGPGSTELRAFGLAAGFVTAHAAELPFMTHARQPWRAVSNPCRFRKLRLLGAIDWLVARAAAGRISPEHGWETYVAIAATPAGEQPAWSAPKTRESFLKLANLKRRETRR